MAMKNKLRCWVFVAGVAAAASFSGGPRAFCQEIAAAPAAEAPGDAAGLDSANSVSGVAEDEAGKEAFLDPNLYVGLQEAFDSHMKLGQPQVQPQQLKTIFFTLWQHKLLLEAKRLFTTRPPSESELSEDSSSSGPRDPGIREIKLGGILYAGSGNWIVWLNGLRVTPEAIPKEVMDIKVHADYVELKWYDAFSNLIFPIRLQAHQRFNLDSRIFLPGTAL